MTKQIHKFINDNPWARWTALVLIASMMFFAYMFVDVMAPLKSLLEPQLGWSSSAYGTYRSSEYILNVFGFLIIAGIILDKMGIRFTGTLSASMMVIGACVKLYGISSYFHGTGLEVWLNSWWTSVPASAKMASLGFMIFGCGCEMAGTTVSKSIAKWFKGKEMALAMGLEMAIARVGVFAIFTISPWIAESMGSVVAPVAFCTCLMFVGLIFYLVFCVMDTKFDRELAAAKVGDTDNASDEEFKVADLKYILTSQIFWVVALLCVLYYSAIFPFQAYGAEMLQCNLTDISARTASDIFRWFPIGAAIITPFLGSYLDRKGHGATMLIWGALLLIVCHLVFAFVLPATHSQVVAYSTIVVLGVSFALVPAALWPSVPKIIEERVLGSAYCLIFWVQNIGLCFVPLLIGHVLDSVNADNPAVQAAKELAQKAEDGTVVLPEDFYVPYNYTIPLIIFASFGVAAFLIALYLKALDRRKHYGLELPNIQADVKAAEAAELEAAEE